MPPCLAAPRAAGRVRLRVAHPAAITTTRNAYATQRGLATPAERNLPPGTFRTPDDAGSRTCPPWAVFATASPSGGWRGVFC